MIRIPVTKPTEPHYKLAQTIQFGQYKGATWEEIRRSDPNYVRFIERLLKVKVEKLT